jgi:predicted metal-dependent phosphoesterase TrpH
MRVEFHCHSRYSKDSLNPLEGMIQTARQRGIDRLIITDHSTIRGAVRAQRMAPDLVIVGEEVRTSRGELLAAYVQEEIPRGLEPQIALRLLREQGAFISVPHPFEVERNGWEIHELLEIIPLVDAIEVFNSRCVRPQLNKLAAEFAQEHDLVVTVGSDAHSLREIGRSVLELPSFQDAVSLRNVIRQGKAETRLSSPFVHFSSVYARIYKGFHPEVMEDETHTD